MAADENPPTPVNAVPVTPRSRHHVKWKRVPVIVVAGVVSFFLIREGFFFARDEIYDPYVYPHVPTLPTLNSERQIPHDVPGFMSGCYSKEGYGYEPAKYVIYVPPGRAGNALLPLIVCLHGSGDHTGKYLTQGLAPVIRKQAKAGGFPMAVLFPTDSTGRWAPSSPAVEDVLRLIDHAVVEHGIDPDRVYLTGWSNGGTGTWMLAAAYPERWAAIVPACGLPEAEADRVSALPCWAFVGGMDKQVPAERVEAFVRTLREKGTDARITVFPKTAHDVWDPTYGTPELFEWLARQRRQGAAARPH